jgi:hypothetical protein
MLHVVPEAIRYCTHDGTYKDIIGRVQFFETSGIDYKQVMISADDPSQLDQSLKQFSPTHVLLEYTYYRNVLNSLRERLPKAFIAARAINIEPLQHFANHGLFPKRGSLWLLYGMLRFFLSDLAHRRKADMIYPISEWESRMYWRRLPGKSRVKWLPYFPPDFVVGRSSTLAKQNMIACIPGRADHPRNRDAVRRFIGFAEIAKRMLPDYRFVITGDLTDCGIAIPDYFELPGLVDSIAEFLAPVRAVAVLSPLGYGFKTTIADAQANHCYALVHPLQLNRGPAILRDGCLPVETLTGSAVARALEQIGRPFPDSPACAFLRDRALNTLREDFLDY